MVVPPVPFFVFVAKKKQNTGGIVYAEQKLTGIDKGYQPFANGKSLGETGSIGQHSFCDSNWEAF